MAGIGYQPALSEAQLHNHRVAGQNLYRLRSLSGYTMQDVTDLTTISKGLISTAEKGGSGTGPTPSKLAKFYGYEYEDLQRGRIAFAAVSFDLANRPIVLRITIKLEDGRLLALLSSFADIDVYDGVQ